jgi:hypothetical protein
MLSLPVFLLEPAVIDHSTKADVLASLLSLILNKLI